MCRTPHGVRGLKLRVEQTRSIPDLSHPSRGAWIEIISKWADYVQWASHPSRGAWIEIVGFGGNMAYMLVAPLTGCVD